MGRKPRSTFILKSINVDELFNFYYRSSKSEEEESHITLLNIDSDISRPKKRDKHLIRFNDIHRKNISYYPTMIDITKNEAVILPQYTTQRCHNCHYTFTNRSLGCPISYKTQGCSRFDKEKVEKFFKDNNFTLEEGTDFFVTEWIFCSLPCIKRYILKQISIQKSSKYHHALTLLTLLTIKFFGENKLVFTPQTDIQKTLKDYGGHLTIEEQRALDPSTIFIDSVNVKRPYLFPCSEYIEERKLR
jgi:hypothetical protein